MLYNILPSKIMYYMWGGVSALLLCVPVMGGGQQAPRSQAAQVSGSSQVISAAFPRPVTPPHDDWYKIPHYCASQARRVADSVVWGQRADTIPWRSTDTLPTVVRMRARACMAHVKLDQVGRWFIEAAARVALIAGTDSLLLPAIDSLIVMERDSRMLIGSKDTLVSAGRFFVELLSAAPARVNLARLMLARSRVLNGSAYLEGKGNKLLLASQTDLYQQLNHFGQRIADVHLMEEGRDSMMALFHAFESENKDSVNEYDRVTYNGIALQMTHKIHALRFGSDSILKSVERVLALYETIFPGQEKAIRNSLGILFTGKPTPSAAAPFTFFREGVTHVPHLGKPMVVLRVGELCEGSCASEIMRFKSLIGDVPIVMIAEVFGNVRKSNPGTAAENAEALRAHLQDSLGINLSLLVDIAPRYVVPAPDLQHLYGTSSLLLNWADAGPATVFNQYPKPTFVRGLTVLDKHGRVVWDWGFYSGQQDNKEFLASVIKKIASE